MGRPELPGVLADRLVVDRPLDPRAWCLAARTRETLPARLAAVRRALDLAPRFTEAVQLEVDLLAEAGRFDEAVAAVRAPPWQGPPPRLLRLRVAQLEAQRGRAAEARAALDDLLAAEPDFLEGWEAAVEWHDEAGRHQDCLLAARQLVRLAPQRPTSLGWLGLAQLACGERTDAKEALARAVHLDPAYRWAVRRLFSLRVEDREWDGAMELMALAERHFDPAEVPALRLELATGRRHWRQAATELAALAPVASPEALEAAVKALLAARDEGELERALQAPLGASDGARAAGLAWFAWARQALSPSAIESRLEPLLRREGPRGPALAGAVRPWLELLAETGQRPALLRWVKRLGPWLATDPELWGATGYALTRGGEHARAVRWLQANQPEVGLAPWMLSNLGYSLCRTGRLAEGAAACRQALRLPPDHTRSRLEVVVALEAALRGATGPAARLRPGEDLGPDYSRLAAMALALAAGLGEETPSDGWAAAVPHLARLRSLMRGEQAPAFAVLRWRSLWRLGYHLGRGGPLAIWWFLRALLRG